MVGMEEGKHIGTYFMMGWGAHTSGMGFGMSVNANWMHPVSHHIVSCLVIVPTTASLHPQKGHERIVDMLLKAGANKEAAKDTGATPLYIACAVWTPGGCMWCCMMVG